MKKKETLNRKKWKSKNWKKEGQWQSRKEKKSHSLICNVFKNEIFYPCWLDTEATPTHVEIYWKRSEALGTRPPAISKLLSLFSCGENVCFRKHLLVPVHYICSARAPACYFKLCNFISDNMFAVCFIIAPSCGESAQCCAAPESTTPPLRTSPARRIWDKTQERTPCPRYSSAFNVIFEALDIQSPPKLLERQV